MDADPGEALRYLIQDPHWPFWRGNLSSHPPSALLQLFIYLRISALGRSESHRFTFFITAPLAIGTPSRRFDIHRRASHASWLSQYWSAHLSLTFLRALDALGHALEAPSPLTLATTDCCPCSLLSFYATRQSLKSILPFRHSTSSWLTFTEKFPAKLSVSLTVKSNRTSRTWSKLCIAR